MCWLILSFSVKRDQKDSNLFFIISCVSSFSFLNAVGAIRKILPVNIYTYFQMSKAEMWSGIFE